MTIQVPDDLARSLEGIAATQYKSAEQMALESLRSLFDKASSPEVLLRAVRELSDPSAAAVDDLDAAIAAARSPFTGSMHASVRSFARLKSCLEISHAEGSDRR